MVGIGKCRCANTWVARLNPVQGAENVAPDNVTSSRPHLQHGLVHVGTIINVCMSMKKHFGRLNEMVLVLPYTQLSKAIKWGNKVKCHAFLIVLKKLQLHKKGGSLGRSI